ncbi:hypothetical protein PINS_up009720 [Pythium insidiosum]|nr:hypothetical protein PINS_up009720 [Pythium insidiosum]
MARIIRDDVPTSDVVWQAATRIGKTGNTAEIHRLTEYLVGKHWFQNAGDLRAARQATQEWQALEVPARLKIAIQELLDECQVTAISDPLAANAESASNTEGIEEHNGDWYTETSVAADGSWSVSDEVAAARKTLMQMRQRGQLITPPRHSTISLQFQLRRRKT